MAYTQIPAPVLQILEVAEPGSTFVDTGGYIASSRGRTYLVKSTTRNGEQYHGEAESLRFLRAAAPNLAPQLYSCIDVDGTTHFVSEFMDISPGISPARSLDLARRLATEVHQFASPNGMFGFGVPSYCGATRVAHGWFATWEECFTSMIRELLAAIRVDRPQYEGLCVLGEQVCTEVIPRLLGKLDVAPVLLHGDLWSGNVGTRNQRAVVFDPASYFGHNEAELSICRVFGGFSTEFYDLYHTIIPKTEPVEEYEDRQNIYELFHYLNHTLLFGEGYLAPSLERIHVALDSLPEDA